MNIYRLLVSALIIKYATQFEILNGITFAISGFLNTYNMSFPHKWIRPSNRSVIFKTRNHLIGRLQSFKEQNTQLADRVENTYVERATQEGGWIKLAGIYKTLASILIVLTNLEGVSNTLNRIPIHITFMDSEFRITLGLRLLLQKDLGNKWWLNLARAQSHIH